MVKRWAKRRGKTCGVNLGAEGEHHGEHPGVLVPGQGRVRGPVPAPPRREEQRVRATCRVKAQRAHATCPRGKGSALKGAVGARGLAGLVGIHVGAGRTEAALRVARRAARIEASAREADRRLCGGGASGLVIRGVSGCVTWAVFWGE